MKLNVAVQMDPIARINIRGDSTFALLLEAQKRGYGLSYYTPDKLSLKGEELVAPAQILSLRCARRSSRPPRRRCTCPSRSATTAISSRGSITR